MLPDAFHDALRDDPADVATRLVYADWLDDHGDAARAEFVRLQVRLSQAGYTMRIYVPYGTQWYGYLMRRLAERPANLALFARALTSRR